MGLQPLADHLSKSAAISLQSQLGQILVELRAWLFFLALSGVGLILGIELPGLVGADQLVDLP